MTVDIPNLADAAFPAQSKLWNSDLRIIGNAAGGQTGVIGGLEVTAQGSPDMTVAVASGVVKIDGLDTIVAADDVTIAAADLSFDRIDLIVVDGDGILADVTGAAASSPEQPDLPDDTVALAQVYVPAGDTAIGGTQIYDRRISVPGPVVGSVDVQVFTTSGTYIKPAGAQFAEVIAIGGGGGGGSGQAGTGGGGAGGAGGNFAWRRVPGSLLTSTVAVTVGAPAAGGASVSGSANGINGAAGVTSSFGSYVRAGGGSGGQGNAGGTAPNSLPSPFEDDTFRSVEGTSGGFASLSSGAAGTDSPQTTALERQGAAGGGGGSRGGVSQAGGDGGDAWTLAGGVAVIASAGAAGASAAVNDPVPGAGGAGGGCSGTSGRAGGNGGNYGGGGGGGSSGAPSGAGGNGAGGIVYVVTYS